MALPTSGAISLREIATELGKAVGSAITLNDVDVRTLLGKATGAISIADAYGKSNAPPGSGVLTAGLIDVNITGYSNGIITYAAGSITPSPFKTPAGNVINYITCSNSGGAFYLGVHVSNAQALSLIKINGITYNFDPVNDYFGSGYHFKNVGSKFMNNGQQYSIAF